MPPIWDGDRGGAEHDIFEAAVSDAGEVADSAARTEGRRGFAPQTRYRG